MASDADEGSGALSDALKILDLAGQSPTVLKTVEAAFIGRPGGPKPKQPLVLVISERGHLETDLAEMGVRLRV